MSQEIKFQQRVDKAALYASQIVRTVMEHEESSPALIVYDERSELARILIAAYRKAVPDIGLLPFDQTPAETTKDILRALPAKSLVMLVQSDNLRLPNFHIRLELISKGVKVAQHGYLAVTEGDEIDIYLDSLAYDADYYRGVGAKLQEKVDRASCGRLESATAVLHFDSAFKPSKCNLGDFSKTKHAATQFPIGEIFTEAQKLDKVHGTVQLFGFTDLSFRVNFPDSPITVHIEEGKVVRTEHSNEAFETVLAQIRKDNEGIVMVREFGLGMNPAFSRQRRIVDVNAYERVKGTHLSLGAKHGAYRVPGIERAHGTHHVDVFPITERIYLDNDLIFDGQSYVV